MAFKRIFVPFLMLLLLAPVSAAWGQTEEGPLLRVNDLEVSLQAFRRLAAEQARLRFYHFNPPAEEREAFYRELVDELIDQELLSIEAERRGVVPDGDYIVQRLMTAERRFRGSAEQWSEQLPQLTEDLNGRARILALQEQIEERVKPTEAEVADFYRENRELFLEPPRYRVGLILLGVRPWEQEPVWQAKEALAEELVTSLHQGADFAELAQEHSDDPTSEAGGDMGYLHEGMLGTQAEEAVAQLQEVGDISDPVRVLEGVVVVKLLDKQAEVQRALDEVFERAEGLLTRQLQDKRWEDLKSQLRDKAEIVVDESLLTRVLEE